MGANSNIVPPLATDQIFDEHRKAYVNPDKESEEE